MALYGIKFLLPRIVLTAAVFISLSGVIAEEHRRCYWCGPLAEQVHRSQRAPSCGGGSTQVTVCDEGYPYCAVVATSPPYVESRLCIKFYQDECYPLYCNSTKAWRMTCPCRGNLCNGHNTQRENEAFAILSKLVAKTQKRLKRTVKTSKFLGMTTNKKKVEEISNTSSIDVKNDEVLVNDISSENDATAKKTWVDSTTTAQDVATNTEIPINYDSVDKTDVPNTENMLSAAVVTQDTTDILITITEPEVDNIDETNAIIQIDIPSPEIESSDLKTEIIIMSSESPKTNNDPKVNDLMTNMPEKVPQILQTTAGNMNEVVKMSKEIIGTPADMDKITKNKNNEKLPPAEALQHNDTPTVKATEPTTTMMKVMSTQPVMELTTEPMATKMSQNNTAVNLKPAHLLTLFVGIILQY